ncbi:MAG: (d)CMP kinase [Patescibacteria group bacterium]
MNETHTNDTPAKRSVVAIDGPNASGKGSLSRRLAEHLGWPLLDTGLMYRAGGLAVAEAGADLDDEAMCERIIHGLRFELRHPAGLFINGKPADVQKLRSHEGGEAASRVSAYRTVRDHVHRVQRAFAKEGDVVMDGRDIGTVTVPDARYKIYLTASPEVRAARRVKELQDRGIDADYETILADVNRRDERDMNRKHDPLRPAEDALIIDTTDMTPDEVFERALEYLKGT